MTAKYPTDDEFFAAHDEEQIQGLISDMSDYDTKQDIAHIKLDSLPDGADRITVLMVWANFARVMQSLIPEITVTTGTVLYHEMNHKQKQDKVITRWKSDEYYKRQSEEDSNK